MATSLTKNGIESAIVRVRAQPSGRIELRDEKEAGLVFRAGERSSTWSLAVRLQDGQRSRIKLGTWPGMGIAEARAAARVARTQIDQGSNPDERKREIISGRVASPETSGASNWSAGRQARPPSLLPAWRNSVPSGRLSSVQAATTRS